MPSALILSFPEVDAATGDIREHLDPSASWGVPAHVSIIYPFARARKLTRELLGAARAIAADTAPFRVRFERTGWFGDTTLWLDPRPQPRLDGLIARCMAAFPQFPPYGGEFDEVIPHLTIATGRSAQEAKEAERKVLPELPITATAARFSVVAGATQPGGFTVVAEYPFTARPEPEGAAQTSSNAKGGDA